MPNRLLIKFFWIIFFCFSNWFFWIEIQYSQHTNSYLKISNNQELDQHMADVMHHDHPIIVEFVSQHILDVQPAQAMKPDGTQGGLHEMSPFLTKEELDQEMIVKI